MCYTLFMIFTHLLLCLTICIETYLSHSIIKLKPMYHGTLFIRQRTSDSKTLLIQVSISDIGCRCVLSIGELVVFCVSCSEHKLLHSDIKVESYDHISVSCLFFYFMFIILFFRSVVMIWNGCWSKFLSLILDAGVSWVVVNSWCFVCLTLNTNSFTLIGMSWILVNLWYFVCLTLNTNSFTLIDVGQFEPLLKFGDHSN